MVGEEEMETVNRSNLRQIALVKSRRMVPLEVPGKAQGLALPCAHIFLWTVLPLLILITGVLLRNLISSWLSIPIEYLIILTSLLLVLYALTLALRRNMKYLSMVLLGLISLSGIILVALLTQAWSAFWAWLTTIIPLTAFGAISGMVISSEILYRCRTARRRIPSVVRHRQNGILKLTIIDREGEES